MANNQMTDEQRIQSIKKILSILHDKETGYDAFREQHKNKRRAEYESILKEYLYDIVSKEYGAKREETTPTEAKFMLSGKNVMDYKFQDTCGNKAKAFCYVNYNLLPPEERLDLQIMTSVDVDHLVDGMCGHTLPCIKMADGKYYTIDPAIKLTPEQPDVQFIKGNIEVGKEIIHVLPAISDKPYKVMAMMPWPKYEKKTFKFEDFLKMVVERDKRTKMIAGRINTVLKNMNFSDHLLQNLYNFSCAMKNTKLPIYIARYHEEGRDDRHNFSVIIELDNGLYSFSPNREYLFLNRLQNLGENKFEIMDARDKKTFVQENKLSFNDYIKWYENKMRNQTKER